MSTGQEFLQELLLESEVTRRFLERVPFDKADYRPSDKSESLGSLAIHVAEIVAWWTEVARNYELNFLGFEQKDIRSTEELLAYFDQLLGEATRTLTEVKDEEFSKEWAMTHGEEVLFTLPKKQVMRIFCMHHLVHHRSQLGVYLRLLGIPVPATYGPSADDEHVTLIRRI